MAPTITIVFSRHENLGACNALALERIIAHLDPDVIFEELSEEQYKEAYVLRSLNNLESVAIRKYTSYSKVPHIPVDTFIRPKDYDDVQYKLWKELTVGSVSAQDSFQIRSLLDQKQLLINEEGFRFLNSERYKKEIQWLNTLKERIIQKGQDSGLREANARFNQLIEKREETILDNIFNYSKEHDFANGLLLIGSAHWVSLTEKVFNRQGIGGPRLTWNLLGGRISNIDLD